MRRHSLALSPRDRRARRRALCKSHAVRGSVMDPQALAQTVLEIFRRNVTEHYFDMSGRVSRPEFWYFILGCFVASLAAAIIDAIARTGLLVSVVGLALLLPLAGIGARRLQDTGKPGSSVWIAIVPMAVNRVLAFLLGLAGLLGLRGLYC